jgi:hypothetical protein
MIYSSITIYWQEGDDLCSHTCSNVTLKQAKEKAAVWGFKEPAWWQFWRARPVIETLI